MSRTDRLNAALFFMILAGLAAIVLGDMILTLLR
jgi:hypothetical protein